MLRGGDEIIIEDLTLERPRFLHLLVLLGSSTGAPIIVGWRLAFASFAAEESADCFLSRGIVCHHVH